ncbi:hypothetical protein ACUN0C_03850 [Faunimonas sp. B44]|uniref:hypothetical protein n=1 Tax=Faunimonas sp. B44 TaxID=3461493 RepID=UPI0040448DBD
MSSGPRQIPLELGHAVAYGPDSYVVGAANREAAGFIGRWPDWPTPVVALSGPPGSGKTHLAHIWAARSGARLAAATELGNADLFETAMSRPVAVDAIAPGSVPESALFHLINLVRESGTALLLVAREPATGWGVALPDLASRLRLATALRLHEPDEPQLRQVLVKLFADRQLLVERPVLDFMLLRMERSFTAAAAVVAALDRAALADQRRISRALAATVLAEIADPAEFQDRH